MRHNRTFSFFALPAVPALLALAFAASFGLASSPSPARAADPDASKITLGTSSTRLDNGLELVLHEDHRTPIVAVEVWYHVGSKDEAEGRHGFAHLFEHVMFQGSKHVPEDTYFRYLERAGASNVNGSTSQDRTNYFETVPKNRLDLALWLESDRMGFLLEHVDEQTFAGQREVVKNERRHNYENAPYGMVPRFVAEALYPKGHPYHLLTIGSPEDLDAATLDDVRQFFRTWYVPNNATLVIAGDIDPQATRALVDKYFGPIPKGPDPERVAVAGAPVTAAPLTAEKRIEVEAGVELPRVVVTWPSPAFFAPGDADLDLLSRVLTGGKTSRLYKRLVYDMQIAESVMANQESAQLGSAFKVIATAKPGHTPEELLAAIDAELAKVRAASPSDAELARARATFLSREAFSLERVGTRADVISTYVHYLGDPGYLPKDLAVAKRGRHARQRARRRTLVAAGRQARRRDGPSGSRAAPLAGRLKGAP